MFGDQAIARKAHRSPQRQVPQEPADGLGWLYKKVRDWRNGRKVFNFLKTSASTTEYRFRSTEAISFAVKLTEFRVEQVLLSTRR
jgi:hypothetical protein